MEPDELGRQLSERLGGPVVWCGGHYALRDDWDIRDDMPDIVREAYSLFDLRTGRRVEVLVGSLWWAIKQARMAEG